MEAVFKLLESNHSRVSVKIWTHERIWCIGRRHFYKIFSLFHFFKNRLLLMHIMHLHVARDYIKCVHKRLRHSERVQWWCLGPWFLVPNFRSLKRSTRGTWSSLMVFQDKHLLLLLFKGTILVYVFSHVPVFTLLEDWTEKILRPLQPPPSVMLWVCAHVYVNCILIWYKNCGELWIKIHVFSWLSWMLLLADFGCNTA